MEHSKSIVCEWCHNPAVVPWKGNGRPPLFCSDHCRQQARRLQHEQDWQKNAAARMRAYRARRRQAL